MKLKLTQILIKLLKYIFKDSLLAFMSLLIYGMYNVWEYLCDYYYVIKPQVDKHREKKRKTKMEKVIDEEKTEEKMKDETKDLEPTQANKVTRTKTTK